MDRSVGNSVVCPSQAVYVSILANFVACFWFFLFFLKERIQLRASGRNHARKQGYCRFDLLRCHEVIVRRSAAPTPRQIGRGISGYEFSRRVISSL